jgi:hypothetical protein
MHCSEDIIEDEVHSFNSFERLYGSERLTFQSFTKAYKILTVDRCYACLCIACVKQYRRSTPEQSSVIHDGAAESHSKSIAMKAAPPLPRRLS